MSKSDGSPVEDLIVSHSEDTRRVAKNTLMLYGRMLFSMLVSLYTSRVILNTLGVEDYGIQNVVGGFVGMFSLLSGSLSTAIGRFLTFELGKGNKDRLARVFSTSMFVQFVIAVIVVILIETFGVWFINNKMVIPEGRLTAANWLFQFSTLSFALSLISVPYNASIISHEHMKVFASVGIFEVVARLMIVISLSFLPATFDKLIFYSFMLLALGLILQCIYYTYCRKHFEECEFQFVFDKSLLKEMLGFASWNFIGVSSAVLRDQGCNVVLNLFWGPTLNAARGIAQQVSNAVGGFVNNFMTAVNPQITKSYAADEMDYMMMLVYRSARYSYYLLLILSLPVLFNTEYLIDLWLGQVPDHVELYVQLVLINLLCESVSNPLITVMLATGRIRNYQLVVGGLQLLNLPISYILLRLGFFPEIISVVAIVLSISCLAARLVMLQGMVGLSVSSYLKKVILNLLTVSIVAVVFPILVSFWDCPGFLKFITSCLICVLSTCISIYYIGCNSGEREFIKEKVVSFISRFGRA